MKNNITALVMLLVISCPFALYAYSVDLEYGWEKSEIQITREGGYDYIGVEGSVYPTTTLGKVYDMSLLPEGSYVQDYEVLWEEAAIAWVFAPVT